MELVFCLLKGFLRRGQIEELFIALVFYLMYSQHVTLSTFMH